MAVRAEESQVLQPVVTLRRTSICRKEWRLPTASLSSSGLHLFRLIPAEESVET
jgi:hypothetical protein